MNRTDRINFASRASKVSFFMFLLLSVFILLPSTSQADGLFDFQMKLATKGNIEAQFKVGEMYETGFGVSKDMVKAEKWITKAASKGHETANFKLLYWDVQKSGVTADNKEKVEDLKAKANAENPQAQYYLGKMYANGVGVKKNTSTAITLLNRAALVGILEAEREMIVVREDKQRQALAKRRADEKARAAKRARLEKERLAKQDAQRKLQAKQQAEAKAKAQAKANEIARKNKATKDAGMQAAEKANAEAAERAKVLAQRQAEEKRRIEQKQALLKKRAEEETARKAQFESDPCSGKSARFLSTCK